MGGKSEIYGLNSHEMTGPIKPIGNPSFGDMPIYSALLPIFKIYSFWKYLLLFFTKRNIFLSLFLLFLSTSLSAVDYFWIGGSGEWSNISHWATTSGGSITHNVVPTADDNVIFDENSFSTPDQIVTINIDNIFCKDMDWSNATNIPRLQGTSEQVINIFGSLNFIPEMTIVFDGSFQFKSSLPERSINTGAHALGKQLIFDGPGGWILDNSLTTDSLLLLRNGSLNTNSQNLNSAIFHVETTNAGQLILGNSTITITASLSFLNNDINQPIYPLWIKRSNNFTVSSGNSQFRLTAPSAIAKLDQDNLDFYDLTFVSTTGRSSLDMIASMGHTFNSIRCNSNAFLLGHCTINQLFLSPGKRYDFFNEGIYTINNIMASGSCQRPIKIFGTIGKSKASINTNATLEADFISLKNLELTGNGSFTVDNAIDLGNNTGFTINARPISDLFWVGGSGNWDDPQHWSFSSGGPGGACIPAGTDNVFFDQNSFNAPGQTVTVNTEEAFCRDMNWTGASSKPTFFSSDDKQLFINGSLRFIKAMNMNFGGSFNFEGNAKGQTITTANHWISSMVNFRSTSGEWILQDSLWVNLDICLKSGTLRTNDQYVESYNFLSTDELPRTLSLGHSIWVLKRSGITVPTWTVLADDLTFDAGTSTIWFKEINGTINNRGRAPLAYHKIIFDNNTSSISDTGTKDQNTFIDTLIFKQGGFLYSDYNIGNLILTSGYAYRFGNNTTQTINNIVAQGRCEGMITLSAVNTTETAKIAAQKDHPHLSRLILKDIHSIGPGQLMANQSINLGNTNGWMIENLEERELFWVGNNGNWEDPMNWSLQSGGLGGECIPTPIDDVFFDQNSFKAPFEIVNGSFYNSFYCRNMFWSNIEESNSIRLPQLRIYGNLRIAPNVSWEVTETIFHGTAEHHIFTNNVPMATVRFESPGEYRLEDSFKSGSLFLTLAKLHTNDQDIEVGTLAFLGFNTAVEVSLGDSHIRITGTKLGSSFPFRMTSINGGLILDAGNSLIEFTAPNTGMQIFGGLEFHNILFSATAGKTHLKTLQMNSQQERSRFNNVQFNNDGLIEGIHFFDSLSFAPGKSYELEATLTQEIGQYFKIVGNNCNPIELSSTQAGVRSRIQMRAGTVNGDFIQMQDQIAIGGATFYAGIHSTNIDQNNFGWLFETRATYEEVGFLGEDDILCAGMPVTLSAFNASPGEQYQWSTGSNAAEILIEQEGSYWVKVTFANSCEIVDTVNILSVEDFEIDLGQDTTLCVGDSLLLQSNVEAAGLLRSWQDGSIMPDFLVSQAGTYSLELALQGCYERDTITVDYLSPPLLELGNDQFLCEGDTLLLSVPFNNQQSYVWENLDTSTERRINESGLYQLTISNEACQITDSVRVTIQALPIFSLGADTSICEGEVVHYDFTGLGDQYLWQNGSTEASQSIQTPGIQQYWLNVQSKGCSFSDSIIIEIKAQPQVALLPYYQACEGDTITLDITQNQAATYFWNTGTRENILMATESGNYIYTINLNDCIEIGSVEVDILSLAAIDLGQDTTICEGESISFDFSDFQGTFLWSDGSTAPSFSTTQAGLVSLNFSDACSLSDSIHIEVQKVPDILLPLDTTSCEGSPLLLKIDEENATVIWNENFIGSEFSVVEDSRLNVTVQLNNCQNTHQIQVEFIPIPAIDLGEDQTLCEGESFTLLGGTEDYTYLWQDGSTSNTLMVTETGTYSVKVFDSYCSNRDSITLFFEQAPILDLGPDTIICENEILNLYPLSSSTSNLAWNTGRFSETLPISEAGIYWAEATLNDCLTRDSILVNVQALPDLDLGPDSIICLGETFEINPGISGNYLWHDGSKDTSFQAINTGIYTVNIQNGNCIIEDDIYLEFQDCEQLNIYIPNAFSPNRDGQNDAFRAYLDPYYEIEVYNLKIFDKWGNFLFESNSIEQGWDGRYKGEWVSPGVYVYMISLSFRGRAGLQDEILTGDISIIK